MKRKRRQNRQRRYSPAALTYRGVTRLSAPSVTIDRGLAWFGVWTAPQADRQVELRLRQAGFATYLPAEASVRLRKGTLRPVERLPVGRYLFVGLSASAPSFGHVRGIEGVMSFVASAGDPLRIPASELQAYADFLASKVVDFRGAGFGRLLAIMAQADDAKARERGPFWTEEAA